MSPYLPKAFSFFFNQLQISSAEKNMLENIVEIMPLVEIMAPPFKIIASPLSGVYQHFSNEGSKFCSQVAVKDFQDCDSIIPLHFCLRLANYYLKKNAC